MTLERESLNNSDGGWTMEPLHQAREVWLPVNSPHAERGWLAVWVKAKGLCEIERELKRRVDRGY